MGLERGGAGEVRGGVREGWARGVVLEGTEWSYKGVGLKGWSYRGVEPEMAQLKGRAREIERCKSR